MDIFWHHAPLVRILIPLVLGILTALHFDEFSQRRLLFLLPALVFLVLLLSLKSYWKSIDKNHYFGLIASILLFILGLNLTYRSLSRDMMVPEADAYLAVIESTPIEKKNSFAVNLMVFKAQVDSHSFQGCSHRVIAYFSKEAATDKLTPSQTLVFSGKISKPPDPIYPNQFNYGQYLSNSGISGTVYLSVTSYDLVQYKHHTIRSSMNGIRKKITDRLELDSIPSREFGVISALLLGDRSMLDPELKTDFADAGAVHILAVSGLHVGIIYLLFMKILTLFLSKRARLMKFLLILLILWGYAALTGFSPSVLRAATMFSFIALGKHHNRYGNIYNMIAASAIALLIATPLLITQIGFQMSYLAVLGIIFFHAKFRSFLSIDNKILDYCWSLVCVSIAAQLATFPLSIYYFHQFPSMFILTNILVIPLATLILHVGVIWIVLLWIPFISDILSWVTVTLTWLLNQSIGIINSIPFAKIDNLFLTGKVVFLIYLALTLITLFLLKPSRMMLRALSVSVILLVAIYVQKKISVSLQDEVIFTNTTQDPVVMRLIQNRLVVHTQDSLKFMEKWKWELYPYFLTRGIDKDHIEFTNPESGHVELDVKNTAGTKASLGISWNPQTKTIRLKTKKGEKTLLRATERSLICLNSEKLTRFSGDLPLQPK